MVTKSGARRCERVRSRGRSSRVPSGAFEQGVVLAGQEWVEVCTRECSRSSRVVRVGFALRKDSSDPDRRPEVVNQLVATFTAFTAFAAPQREPGFTRSGCSESIFSYSSSAVEVALAQALKS